MAAPPRWAWRVEDAALLAALAGRSPDGELQLVSPAQNGRRMPGIDACFKAPKSVSLLWTFGDRVTVGARTLDRVVEDAHDEAVEAALSYLESVAARGRRGHDGLVQVETSGFVAAAFRQRTSRADEPPPSHARPYREHVRGQRRPLGRAGCEADLCSCARDRLVAVGVVERDGLDVRGVTIGVGDQVIVLRNDRPLGVINGTLGTITAIDRERGNLLLRTVEPDPRDVRLPASYWNAKGRRRVSLAYCRTIHKAQGATYRGESFTLAGDDTIHLEAVHVALSRGARANTLYYVGEPPSHEDHHAAEVAASTIEELVAAAGRSRAQMMALDVLDAPAPMTESQAATLVRRGVVPEVNLTRVQASRLIDDRRGGRAASPPRAPAANAHEAANASPGPRKADAMDVRLEVLETAAQRGPPPVAGGWRRAGGAARLAGGRNARPPARAARGVGTPSSARCERPHRQPGRPPPRDSSSEHRQTDDHGFSHPCLASPMQIHSWCD